MYFIYQSIYFKGVLRLDQEYFTFTTAYSITWWEEIVQSS